MPQWFNSFFNRTQEPERACKIYVYIDRLDPVVLQPTNGMSETTFRQLDGPVVFQNSEVVSGQAGMSLNGLLRIDFSHAPRVVWEPL